MIIKNQQSESGLDLFVKVRLSDQFRNEVKANVHRWNTSHGQR